MYQWGKALQPGSYFQQPFFKGERKEKETQNRWGQQTGWVPLGTAPLEHHCFGYLGNGILQAANFTANLKYKNMP